MWVAFRHLQYSHSHLHRRQDSNSSSRSSIVYQSCPQLHLKCCSSLIVAPKYVVVEVVVVVDTSASESATVWNAAAAVAAAAAAQLVFVQLHYQSHSHYHSNPSHPSHRSCSHCCYQRNQQRVELAAADIVTVSVAERNSTYRVPLAAAVAVDIVPAVQWEAVAVVVAAVESIGLM